MKTTITTIILLIFIISCKPDLSYETHGYTQKIIVDGYISNNEFPRVYLTLNVPIWKKVDSISILENVIRTAKVSITDGENTEILTAAWDKNHFPPYVYKGTDIRGVSGKIYKLKVEYSGITIDAETTIPSDPNFIAFSYLALKDNDSLRIMTVDLNIDIDKKNSFRVFSKKRKEKYFIETPFVYNSEFTLSGIQRFNISPNVKELDLTYDEGIYFKKGDTVQVKICSYDAISTLFFKDLTIISSSNSGLAADFFIGEKNGLKSNISNPGFGIWYGFGVKEFEVIVQ